MTNIRRAGAPQQYVLQYSIQDPTIKTCAFILLHTDNKRNFRLSPSQIFCKKHTTNKRNNGKHCFREEKKDTFISLWAQSLNPRDMTY